MVERLSALGCRVRHQYLDLEKIARRIMPARIE